MKKVKINRFKRPIGQREYRKVFTVFPEGKKTEGKYLSIIKAMVENVSVNIQRGGEQTQPLQLLAKAKKYIRDDSVGKNEQIWIVVDVDGRSEADFQELFAWAKSNAKYRVAISSPNFEYWLLIHFESGDGVRTTADCMTRLEKHLPSYNKSNLSSQRFTREHCNTAIKNGRKRDSNKKSWHDSYSGVYRLLLEIFGES